MPISRIGGCKGNAFSLIRKEFVIYLFPAAIFPVHLSIGVYK